MDNNITKERRMGTDPIYPLIFRMSLPSMFSMLILALYNVVDSVYVSRLGEYALSAVSLIYPIQMINVAVGVGTGVGLSSLISRKLGEQKYDEAQSAANHGIFISFLHWIVFVIIGFFLVKPFVYAFSETENLINAAIDYGSIVCIGCLFAFISTAGERIMQACGNMIAPMFCSLAGCITNIILDPIMIFGYLGCPAMGVAGAAYATVIGQLVTMVIIIVILNKRHFAVKIELKGFKMSKITLKQIYEVAFPSMLMQSITSITTVCLNAILIKFSESAVAALGVYFKLQSFVFMPVFGMNQGVMPILGYNYGAKNKKRFIETMVKALSIAFVIMTLGTVIFQLFSGQLMGLFKAEGDLLRIGSKALETISWCFPCAALCIILGTSFQATGHGFYSLIVSIARQLVVIVPVAYLFSIKYGADGVWYAYPVAELMGLAISIILFRKLYKEKIKNL